MNAKGRTCHRVARRLEEPGRAVLAPRDLSVAPPGFLLPLHPVAATGGLGVFPYCRGYRPNGGCISPTTPRPRERELKPKHSRAGAAPPPLPPTPRLCSPIHQGQEKNSWWCGSFHILTAPARRDRGRVLSTRRDASRRMNDFSTKQTRFRRTLDRELS
jgi:hypothetical protein